MDREEKVRERAHAIWQEEGEPQDRAADHWQRAEQEIEAESAEASQLHEDVTGSPKPGRIGKGKR